MTGPRLGAATVPQACQLQRLPTQQVRRESSVLAGQWPQRSLEEMTRQEKAPHLATEIDRMKGAWSTSPLPLEDCLPLRFQVLDTSADEVLGRLRDWGWDPIRVSTHPRVTANGFEQASVFAIDLPQDARPQQTTKPPDDAQLREREKTSHEVAAMRRYLGWDK